jgi:hypothetical protein
MNLKINFKHFKFGRYIRMARLRKGKHRPPEKISVSILRSDHDYLADAIAGTDKPLYEVIHSRLVTESVMKVNIMRR